MMSNKKTISINVSEGVGVPRHEEQFETDDSALVLCLRAVRFNSAVTKLKDHRYCDVPSYGVVLHDVQEALWELDIALKPVRKIVPEASLLVSGIHTLIEEVMFSLDQHDYGELTEESIEEVKQDCERLISIVFEGALRFKISELNPAWVSYVTSKLDEEQLRKRDEVFLRKANERGVSLFKSDALSASNSH